MILYDCKNLLFHVEDQQIAEHLALSSCLLYLNLHTSECWQFRKIVRDLLSTHDKRETDANILVAWAWPSNKLFNTIILD